MGFGFGFGFGGRVRDKIRLRVLGLRYELRGHAGVRLSDDGALIEPRLEPPKLLQHHIDPLLAPFQFKLIDHLEARLHFHLVKGLMGGFEFSFR